MEVMTMVRFRFAMLAAAGLALATSGGRFLAEEQGEPAKKHDHLEKLAAKLKLDDKQKEEIRKIHAAFDVKADPMEHQIWALHHKEHEAMKKVLTAEQRAKAAEILKSLADQEFQKASAELKLSDEQQAKINKIREEYEPKFHALAAEKEKGEKVHKHFREHRHQMISAIRAELNDEQRAKLPAFLREEHRFWRNAESRREHFKALGEKLGVSAEQKEQFRTLHNEYDPKVKALHADLKKLHQEEHAAIERVLTEEQRAQWKELHNGRISR
jgi:Spy/CpxP family protein refolding chaperone